MLVAAPPPSTPDQGGAPPPWSTTQLPLVVPAGLAEPQPSGWQDDFIGPLRGDFDLSFGAKIWLTRFYLRNLIADGTIDLAPGLRIHGLLRRREGERYAFRVDTDEAYLEEFRLYHSPVVEGGASLKLGRVRYLHFPYPDAISEFDQVPAITDLYGGPDTGYRDAILEGEAALRAGWGAHFTGLADALDGRPRADVVEAYAFYRHNFLRAWHFETRAGDIAVRAEPLGRAGQPGVDAYLGRQLGEFNVGLLYEHKRTEPDFSGIMVQFRPGPVTRALGHVDFDYSRRPEGFTVQVPLWHGRLRESMFVRKNDVLVGEVRAVRVRTLWQQGFVRNQYEFRVESWGDTSSPGLHCVVKEDPWYLQTEALVSPHLVPDARWFSDREGPGQFVQVVTYRFYRLKASAGAGNSA